MDVKEKQGKIKELVRRSLQSLPPQKHIQFLQKYSLLEYKANNFEAARTNFENMVANFPKRNDIWNVFIDAEIKHTKDVEYIRTLFERATSLRNNLKITQGYFKKFLAFEEKFGDENSQNHVKSKAERFVQDFIDARQSTQPVEEFFIPDKEELE